MSLLKSYTCKDCGGVLNFDEDQGLFACPFCGTEFNYTDFHRDELISQAYKCLAGFRYRTAKEKLEVLLSNNGRDFEALRGMILVEGNIASLDKFEKPEDLRGCDFAAARKAAVNAKNAVNVESEIKYFEELLKLIDQGEDFCSKLQASIDNNKIARKQYKEHADEERTMTSARRTTENIAKVVLICIACVSAGMIIAAVRTAFERDITWLVPASLTAAAVLFVLYFLIFFIVRAVAKRRYPISVPTKDLTAEHVIEDYFSDETLAARKLYMDAFVQLKKADPAANGYTPPPAPKKSPASSPFINIEKTVICAKCGGQLLLDKEKGLFECKFCGVAYGTSLFFNNPLEKANKALNKADYIEADQRYSHMLMIDPSDFDALLGRVFCVGKWKSIEDIRLSETMIPVVVSKLRERIGEAVKHCQDEDRKFFKTLEQFAEVIISYAETEQEIKKCSKESELVKYKTEIHIVGDKTQKELAGKTSELENRINTCKTTKQNLYKRFGEIREELFTESTHHDNRMAVLKARGG